MSFRFVMFGLFCVWMSAAWAADPSPTDYRLMIGEGRLINLPSAAMSVILADPSIADVQTPTHTQVFIFGKKPGRTSLFVMNESGGTMVNYRVIVNYTDDELRRLVKAEVGNLPVSLTYVPNGAVLSGTVPTPEEAERVRSIAVRFLGEGQALVDNLKVTGHIQVEVRVRVAEVSRSVTKQLGVNWSGVGRAGNVAVGLVTGRAVADTAGGSANALSAGNGVGSLFGSYISGSSNVTGVIDALATEGLIKILAEPNLVAASGETASFLSGGQFPVPVTQGTLGTSIQYQNYGISLKFQPTVLSDDLIGMKVSPSVSELSTTGSVTENGFNVPSLTIRQAETTIELGSGQSFAIAGLIQDDFNTTLQQFPGLADIPVLGALFRSSAFQRNETELVIIVTPTIVRPAAQGSKVKLPTDLVAAPSDFELMVQNRLSHIGGSVAGAGAPSLHGDYGFLLE